MEDHGPHVTFNILEIPLRIHYDNKSTRKTQSAQDTISLRMVLISKYGKIWNWFKPSFKSVYKDGNNCFDIKTHYQSKTKPALPQKEKAGINKINISEYFETNHEFFRTQRSNYYGI